MKCLLPWCTIPSAKVKESFPVNSLDVVEESLGTKNFASLKRRVPIAESIGLNGGQKWVMALCTLQTHFTNPLHFVWTIHLNIKSLNKSFELFLELYSAPFVS